MSVELVPKLLRLILLMAVIKPTFEYFYPCEGNYGITEEEANAVMDDWPRNLKMASVNLTHKCYVSCILWYFGIVDSYGKVELSEYFNSGVIDEHAVIPTINHCQDQHRDETDLCERIFGLFHCLRLQLLATN